MPVNWSLPSCLAQRLFSPPHLPGASFFTTSSPVLGPVRHFRKTSSRAKTIPLPSKKLQRKTSTPFSILFVFGTTFAFYSYTAKQPLLCEAPQPLERPARNFSDSLVFPSMDSINKTFATKGISYVGLPHCGFVRYDCISMPANQPTEDITSDILVGDPDEIQIPGAWLATMWGLYDGHV